MLQIETKCFQIAGIKLFGCRDDDVKSDFCSLKIFKVLIDCLDAQHEILPKSYSSSRNRKNLPTQFLSQRRYFILNFKNIDRFLPSVKGRQSEFICFKENWYSGRQHQCLCVYLAQCSCHPMQLCYESYPEELYFGQWLKFGFFFPGENWNLVRS